MQTLTSTKKQQLQKVADELIHLLADTYTLYLKTQNFHWNVTGPHFASLHVLFEEQYKELADATDIIAERIRALGCHAPASFAEFSKLSSLKEAPTSDVAAKDMLKQLLRDHEIIIKQLSHMIEKAEKAHDEGTLDLLTERIRVHEKTAWMLRSSID